ncbi:uncharacterized protein [Dermacentor albipictus]|uniref:uncharacterized protein isoform X2 n=1 Tax=Dermacentor albipictus TaxID=60249 RepID=UPI0038FC953F
MAGTSKNHPKSALRASSPQLRERRVSFAVPYVEESTAHVTGPSAAPVFKPATEGPLFAAYQLSHECGGHFYTYCTAAAVASGVYYSASSHACLSAAEDSVHLCNRGANRFPNLGGCLASCVHADGGEPHDRCYESTLFTTCTRQDVPEAWWYYNGSACTEWNFPLGKCPSLGRRVYRSREECDRACPLRRQRGNTTVSRRRRCDSPAATTCTPQQVKYPYFADMQAQSSARCVKATSHTLQERRCLIGSNRFDSVASCEQSCVHL